MSSFVLNKLTQRRIWARIYKERLTEPLHLNLISAAVWLFGSYEAKVAHDLVVRQHNAYCILQCAKNARALGIDSVTLIEFGVAAGAGLLNMARIAASVTRATGVKFKIYGFDTGSGMPAARDYRDHPDLYQQSDFPMDAAKLRAVLPANVELVIGDVSATVPDFLARIDPTSPIGYVVLDLDYYTSTCEALGIFRDVDARKYLPVTLVYLDDISHERHNSWCGELLAIREFNAEPLMRKIERHAFLESERIFKRASWLNHVYYLHTLDHPKRTTTLDLPIRALVNPYL